MVWTISEDKIIARLKKAKTQTFVWVFWNREFQLSRSVFGGTLTFSFCFGKVKHLTGVITVLSLIDRTIKAIYPTADDSSVGFIKGMLSMLAIFLMILLIGTAISATRQ